MEEIGNGSYDLLPDKAKELIRSVKQQFADLFDNDEFGPFIEEFTAFSDDRWAMLLDLAVGDVAVGMTYQGATWTDSNYPYSAPAARRALQLALTIEMVRHLVRSYTEIPDTGRVGAPDLVRRDYMSRWQSVLADYQQQLKDACKTLDATDYADDLASGNRYKALIDWPSAANSYLAWNDAERPMWAGWW